MRKTFFILLALTALTTLSLTSCLQYDEPGDEFEMGQLRPGDSAVTAKPAVPQPVFGE
jgi:hypothetical protein